MNMFSPTVLSIIAILGMVEEYHSTLLLHLFGPQDTVIELDPVTRLYL